MIPIFKNATDWEQAERLMQPSLIRVIDNLRKQLEESVWKGTYQDIETPYPGHQLQLTYQDHHFAIAVWDLCFQVCFLDYQAPIHQDGEANADRDNHQQEVSIDTSLFEENGEINWQKLESKTQNMIQTIFQNLPNVS
ncbi:MAG: hypothetical protein VKJ02_02225 [Snowella sp.]|nr:hypothetical protein [Snowella sp.]